MKEMRADMGGAATTLSAAWAIAKLQIPVNLVLCIPLTENMPSGKATKVSTTSLTLQNSDTILTNRCTQPGDVVVASNGVTIEVDNTDAEGTLSPNSIRLMPYLTFCESDRVQVVSLSPMRFTTLLRNSLLQPLSMSLP